MKYVYVVGSKEADLKQLLENLKTEKTGKKTGKLVFFS